MKHVFKLLCVVMLFAAFALGQTATTTTTLSAAALSSDKVISVTSATGFTVGYYALVDKEIVKVTAINGTLINVARGQGRGLAGKAVGHLTGSAVFVGLASSASVTTPFYVADPLGTCTVANVYSPTISLESGDRFECLNGEWTNIIKDEIAVSYTMLAQASLADQTFFVASRPYQVTGCREVHSVLGTDASAVNVQVVKDTSTNAPGAGTDLLTNSTNAGFDLKGTINTVQTGTLTSTIASLRLAAGDRLAVDFAGTLTAVAGVTVSCTLKPY